MDLQNVSMCFICIKKTFKGVLLAKWICRNRCGGNNPKENGCEGATRCDILTERHEKRYCIPRKTARRCKMCKNKDHAHRPTYEQLLGGVLTPDMQLPLA